MQSYISAFFGTLKRNSVIYFGNQVAQDIHPQMTPALNTECVLLNGVPTSALEFHPGPSDTAIALEHSIEFSRL